MYKLANWFWRLTSSLTMSAVMVIIVGAIAAILIKAFMFGFNLIWNFL